MTDEPLRASSAQEALAQALHAVLGESRPKTAAAILDALPEGWELVQAKGYETDLLKWAAAAGEAVGAQQERERLREQHREQYALLQALPGSLEVQGMLDVLNRHVLRLLADPEDER